MRTGDFLLNSKRVDWYQNDKLMGKEIPSEYTRVKAIENSVRKVRIKLG